jgi:hypothetical protein
MVSDEKFNITFEKVVESAGIYKERTTYHLPFTKVYDRALRKKLSNDPNEESVRRLIWSVNQLRNRTSVSKYPKLPSDLLAVLSRNTGRNASVRGVALESPVLSEATLESVQHIFRELCNVRGFGRTGASKFLGVLHPQLCVMWDKPIRQAYGYKGEVPEYSRFLHEMQSAALGVVADAAQNHGIANPADYISDKYGISPGFTLATFINHYIWVTFTKGKE